MEGEWRTNVEVKRGTSCWRTKIEEVTPTSSVVGSGGDRGEEGRKGMGRERSRVEGRRREAVERRETRRVGGGERKREDRGGEVRRLDDSWERKMRSRRRERRRGERSILDERLSAGGEAESGSWLRALFRERDRCSEANAVGQLIIYVFRYAL